MPLTEEKRPYELLARWDTKTGLLKGAHVAFANVVFRDGAFVAETIDNALPLDVGQGKGFPLDDILPALNQASLVKVAEHEATLAAKSAELEAVRAELAAAHTAIAEGEALIAALNGKLAQVAALASESAP